MTRNQSQYRSGVIEALESRVLLSIADVAPDVDADYLPAAKHGAAAGPQIRLDIVALHEFGHSLGLPHSSDPSSLMYPYYNPGYNLADFANDSAVSEFRDLYSSESTRPWKDALDADGGVTDGDVDLTYSFVRDGARMDQGRRSNTFATFNKLFGAGNWESTFVTALQRWASVSNGTLQVHPFDADGVENSVYKMGALGAAQNDPRFGDIRIAAHKFDGPGKVLGHTYYPPPNAGTAAGDSHYDSAENWVLGSGPLAKASKKATAPAAATLSPNEPAWKSPFSNRAPIHVNDLLGAPYDELA